MLKLILKHVIYEKCIQVLFNNIKTAFNTQKVNVLIKGHKYKEIQFIRRHKYENFNYLIDIFRDVTFTDITTDKNGEIWFAHDECYTRTISAVKPQYIYNVEMDEENKCHGGCGYGFEYKIIKQ